MSYTHERVRMAASTRALKAAERVLEDRRLRQEAYDALKRKEDARLKRQRLRERLT
jgi:hypothetical protein